MKRLLLPLVAALALPTAVNAETVWLMISSKGTHAMVKIEMESFLLLAVESTQAQ